MLTYKLKIRKDINIILGKRYILGFIILAFLLVLSHFVIQLAVNDEKSDSRVINIAGRQRMLSQRISKDTLALYIAEDEASKNKYLDDLIYSVELFEKSSIALKNGDKELGLPGENSQDITRLFSNIECNYQNILTASHNIINMSKKGTYTSKSIYSQIQLITKNEKVFLKGMDDIVFQYDAESKSKSNTLNRIGFAVIITIFSVLLMELIFIFKPAEKEINKAFQEIEESHSNILKLFETAPTPMLLIDKNTLDVIQINKLTEELIGINYKDLKLNNILKDNDIIIEKIQNSEKLINEEAILHMPLGLNIIALISSTQIVFNHKEAILLGLSDITKIKKAEAILKRHATIDEMTGLLNKRSGILLLENEFTEAQNGNYDLSIAFIDIDDLKIINDTYGHNEGDWYIKSISTAILSNLPSEDCAFRYGGDEIILVLRDFDDTKTQSMLKEIENDLFLIKKEHNKPYKISISFGIAYNKKTNPQDIEDFVKYADEDMYKNKKKKKIL